MTVVMNTRSPAITGTFHGYSITSLFGLGGFEGNDNLLFYPGTPQFDEDGVSFIAGGYRYNLSEYEGVISIASSLDGGFLIPVSVNSFAAAVTPLPAALPLFATGIGAMGLLGWRRKRKNTTGATASV
jgi:hypothetical protein